MLYMILVPAVKPQIAFYEQYGLEGLRAYQETCEYAKSKGLIVVADIKRRVTLVQPQKRIQLHILEKPK